MQAIVVDPQSPQRVGFRIVEPPAPRATEALIRVKAISLNRGEVVYRVQGEAGTPLGWDLAGVVERPAAEEPGPARGARVVGLLHSGAWAELAAVPANALAELEPSVTFEQAAALPTAGLTALAAIEHGGNLIARSVLVTGASGGVGLIACRLASLAGARVAAQVRQPVSAQLAKEAGAEHVVVGESVAAAERFGPYDLIVEQLGGRALAEAMTQLAPGGTCVSVGVSTGPAGYEVPLDMARMRRAPDACLRILNLYQELEREPASLRLQRLVRLASEGKLTPHLGVEADWREIASVAQALIDRRFPGKAVLRIPDET
ncbi:MAG: zinc-binding dehydrogenase [Nocardiopsaceae bacterium]|nr:zinc-binding dehydrogenase [Nocardiopsaceae bacterium]